jgi:hypothetical protein
MSVSSVSQRANPQPVHQERERQPAKAVDKQPKALPSDRPAAKEKTFAHHADVTYSRAKENTTQHAQPKGRSVDVKA